MIIKTKKHQLTPQTYKKVCMGEVLKTKWWQPLAIFGGVVAFNLLLWFIYFNYWIFVFAPLGAWLWYAFWWVQFTGAPQLPQLKPMFEKFYFEISSKELLMKVNAKEGMRIEWKSVTKVEKTKTAYLLFLSPAQFIEIPFSIFESDHDLNFVQKMIFERNHLLKA